MQKGGCRAANPLPHSSGKAEKTKDTSRDLPRCEVWNRAGSGAFCAGGGQLPTLLLGQVGIWGSAVQSRCLLFGIGGWIWSMSSNTARPCACQGTLLEAESWVMPVIPYPSQEAAQGWGGRPGQKKKHRTAKCGKSKTWEKHGQLQQPCRLRRGQWDSQSHCSRQSLHGHSMSCVTILANEVLVQSAPAAPAKLRVGGGLQLQSSGLGEAQPGLETQ